MTQDITLKELNLLIDTSRVLIIDVRSHREFKDFHIPGAVNVPLEEIESGRFQPEPGVCIITVCASGGGRSKRAASMLKRQFNNPVYSLIGGTYGFFNYDATPTL